MNQESSNNPTQNQTNPQPTPLVNPQTAQAPTPAQPTQPPPPAQQPQKSNNKQIWIIIALAGCLPLLVVIGIIAALFFTSLNGVREKAREAAGKSTLSSISASFAVCADVQGKLQPPIVGKNICTSQSDISGQWPTLPEGWQYDKITSDNPSLATIDAICQIPTCNKEIIFSCNISGCKER